jgi:hypothetical protein
MHTETIRPPRALWVPFVLGRPLGQPADADFQRRVLRNVLGLLERSAADSPVLEDHPEDAVGGVEMEGLSCPISYAPPASDGSLGSRLAQELAGLQVWYDLSVERTGRTAFGVSGLAIDEIATALADAADGELVQPPPGETIGNHLRLASGDLKAYVYEAAMAQPGDLSAYAIKAWFWDQTTAGEVLKTAYEAGLEHPDKDWRRNAPSMIPSELR